MRRSLARVFRDAARRLDPPRPLTLDPEAVMSREQVDRFAAAVIAAAKTPAYSVVLDGRKLGRVEGRIDS